MPPRPRHSRISSCGNNDAISAGEGGGWTTLVPCDPVAPGPSVWVARPALSMHSGQMPPKAVGGTGFPQCGHVFSSAILLLSPHTKEELAKGYGEFPKETMKRRWQWNHGWTRINLTRLSPQPQGIAARERKDVSDSSRVLCVLSRPILCQENKDIRHCSTDARVEIHNKVFEFAGGRDAEAASPPACSGRNSLGCFHLRR